MSLDQPAVRKYLFFGKKGRPTSGEAALLKEIKSAIGSQSLSEKEIVSKFGIANDETTLEQYLKHIKGLSSAPTATIETPRIAAAPTSNPVTGDLPPLHVLTDAPQDIPQEPDQYADAVKDRSYYSEQKGSTPPPQPAYQPPPAQPGTGNTGSVPPSQPPPSSFGNSSDIPETDKGFGGAQVFNAQPINPEIARAAEKSLAEEAKMYVQGYNEITVGLAKKFSRFPEKKIRKLSLDGDIDLNEELELAMGGGSTTVKGFMEDHNRDVEQLIVSDPEITTSMEDCLGRLLKKWNVNAENSDERTMIGLVVIDLKAKAEATAKLYGKMSQCLEFFVSSHKEKMAHLNNPTKKEEAPSGAKSQTQNHGEPIDVNV